MAPSWAGGIRRRASPFRGDRHRARPAFPAWAAARPAPGSVPPRFIQCSRAAGSSASFVSAAVVTAAGGAAPGRTTRGGHALEPPEGWRGRVHRDHRVRESARYVGRLLDARRVVESLGCVVSVAALRGSTLGQRYPRHDALPLTERDHGGLPACTRLPGLLCSDSSDAVATGDPTHALTRALHAPEKPVSAPLRDIRN